MIKKNYKAGDIIRKKDIEKIHDATMDIFENKGVKIFNKEVLKIFEKNGAKIKDNLVFLNRIFIEDVLHNVPSHFELFARNNDNNVVIGRENIIISPGFGAPFVIDKNCNKRNSNYDDYVKFTILSSANKYIDVLGGVLVEPNDISDKLRHLKMFFATAKYSDKCIMGSALGEKKANDCINMASILFEEEKIIDNRPVLISVISTNSPLQYDEQMLDALIVYARNNQALIISSAVMSGSTGPLSLAGTLVLQNVEILLGIILSQIINPGNPVVYGSASTISNMKTANLSVGNPQYSKLIQATTQIANYYNIPSRAGGSITDSRFPDCQASYESMMSLLTSVNSGVDFILHSAGILESYMSMSYEKFIIDQEIIRMISDYQSGIEVNDYTISKDDINSVEHGKHYLTTPYTLKHMRDYGESIFSIKNVKNYKEKPLSNCEQANGKWKSIINNFEPPYLNSKIESKLINYMENAK